MGSLSWSLRPSGPLLLLLLSATSQKISSLFFSSIMGGGAKFHLFFFFFLVASALNTDRSIVKYLGDTFLLPDGCPVNDPMVQRFYKLCLESHQNAPLCTKERLSRTQVLTIPYVTNVCSAICHGMDDSQTTTCPHRARTIIPFTPSNRGVSLQQPSRPDTTFQFGQVLDRTFG